MYINRKASTRKFIKKQEESFLWCVEISRPRLHIQAKIDAIWFVLNFQHLDLKWQAEEVMQSILLLIYSVSFQNIINWYPSSYSSKHLCLYNMPNLFNILPTPYYVNASRHRSKNTKISQYLKYIFIKIYNYPPHISNILTNSTDTDKMTSARGTRKFNA